MTRARRHAKARPAHAAVAPPSTASLVHELPVHQAELETQTAELRRTQLDLAATRDRFVGLYAFAPVGYLTLDGNGRIVDANLTGASLLEVERGSLLGGAFARFVAYPDASRWQLLLPQALQADGSVRVELALQRCSGERFNAQLDCVRVASQAALPLLHVTLTDMSAQRQTEVDRHAAEKAVKAGEAERLSMARELHEELGQRLSALKMELASLCLPSAAPAQAQRITAMLETLDDAVATVRRIATDLRPLMLDDLGLVAAIDWLVRDTARRTGLEITLHTDDRDPPLIEGSAIALYRMVQEALLDIVERRQGSDVCISIHMLAGELVLTIDERGSGWGELDGADDRGFDPAPLRDRARVFGGRLEQGPAPDGGRRLRVRLPLAAGAGTPPSRSGLEPR